MLCTIFALLLIFGIPENWYKSNQFAHTLLLDIIYFTLLFILLVLLGFAFTFAHYLRKKELEIEPFGDSNGRQQNLNFPLNRNTNLNQSIKQQHSIVGSGSSGGGNNNINQQEQPQPQQLELQPQSLSQHQNNNCTCNSRNFFLNADIIGKSSNSNNTGINCSIADKWFPNNSENGSASNVDRTNIQQQFQSNNTGQVNKNNTANNHAYNGCHFSNLARATNLASVVASSNTLDARKLSAGRRNLQLANFALSANNLNYQQQQQQPFILSEIGNIIQDDDKQLLLDSCSFLAPQEFVHKGFYQRDSIEDSVNSSTLVRARSCSRMPDEIGEIDDRLADLDVDDNFLDVQNCGSQDYDHGHDDGSNFSDTGDDETGINHANQVHIELQNFQSKKNSQENRRRRLNLVKTLPDEVLDCATSDFNNNSSSKTQNSLHTRHRPWQALNLVPNNYYGSIRDDSSIHYTNARKHKQLTEEQLFYPQVRHSNNNNQLYQSRHHHHHHHHHRHHKLHKQQYSDKQHQFHQINPKQHSQQSPFSHSPNYASHQTQLLFPFPNDQYQSATMAKQATCRCNQTLKIPASGSNMAVTSTSDTSTANTATTVTTNTTTTASTTLTTTTCSPSTIVAQGLSTINSNQGKHLKANPSSHTAPILLNNSISSFIIKTNKPKSARPTKDSCSNSGRRLLGAINISLHHVSQVLSKTIPLFHHCAQVAM